MKRTTTTTTTIGTTTMKTRTKNIVFAVLSKNFHTSFLSLSLSLSLSVYYTFLSFYHFKSGKSSSFFGDGSDRAVVVVVEGMPKVPREIGGGALGFNCCICGICTCI